MTPGSAEVRFLSRPSIWWSEQSRLTELNDRLDQIEHVLIVP
jgi:hypothetical protein